MPICCWALAFSNKSSTGQPSQYFVQRFIDKVTITLYLTPGDTQAGKFIYFYYVKRIQDAGKYTNEADVVNRFVPCMCAGLSYYISMLLHTYTIIWFYIIRNPLHFASCCRAVV